MKKLQNSLIIMLSLAVVLVIAQSDSVTLPNLNETPMTRFLGIDCSDSSAEAKIVADLRAQESVSETFFISMIEEGPGVEQMEKIKQSAVKQYQIFVNFISSKKRKIDVGGNAFDKASVISETEYVNSYVERFRKKLVVKSLIGLRTLDTERSIKYLRDKQKDSKFQFRSEINSLFSK